MYEYTLTQWILLPDIYDIPSVYHVYHIIVSDIALKTRCLGVNFCRRKFGYIFNHFYAVHPGSYRIRRSNAN